jgi:hypothetical protein
MRGNIINADITIKNMNVWKKKPHSVGQPVVEAILNSEPKHIWLMMYVSGFATKKKTTAV